MARAGGITNAVNVGIAVQADWENREFISHISLNVRRLFEFLVQFEIFQCCEGNQKCKRWSSREGLWVCKGAVRYACVGENFGSWKKERTKATTKSKLAALNEKLDVLERRLEVLEVQVSTASANPSVFS